MRSLVAAVFVSAVACSWARTAPPPVQDVHPAIRFLTSDDDVTIKHHWGLLIAGSAGWGNYRHQADVCHAYQVLVRKGIAPSRIVVMMADDIAHAPENPFPGRVYNRPGGADVYAGVPHDYTGASVNATTFLSVLMGDADAVAGLGSGRVIASGPEDRVFVYYADHGAPGILGMPYGPFLYADDLVSALHSKGTVGGFRELVMFVEACESGSIFEGMLEGRLRIFATSAANDHESSWGTYCPTQGPPRSRKALDTCLGDLYSVAWIENAEADDLFKETLQSQFRSVVNRTEPKSHPQEFGFAAIASEIVADFEGPRAVTLASPRAVTLVTPTIQALAPRAGTPTAAEAAAAAAGPDSAGDDDLALYTSMPQRDADLLPLMLASQDPEASDAAVARAHAALDVEVARRRGVDAAVRGGVEALLAHAGMRAVLQGNLAWSDSEAASGGTLSAGDQLRVEAIMTQPLQRQRGQALVDSWDCLRAYVDAYEQRCGPLSQYGAQHTRTFANLCNAGLDPASWGESLSHSCPSATPQLAAQSSTACA